MAWVERNGKRYFYQTTRFNGQPVRRYIGTGPVAEALAADIESRRAERQERIQAAQAEEAEWRSLTAPLQCLDEAVVLLMRITLVAAGYRQHDRGAWRRKRHVRNHQSPNS